MTKYKLLKPIKNVEWEVGEVKETKEDSYGDAHIKYNAGVWALAHEIALLEHAGFIEEVDEVKPIDIGGGFAGSIGKLCTSQLMPALDEKYYLPHVVHENKYDYYQPHIDGIFRNKTPKRWRAEKGGMYYCLGRDLEVAEVKDCCHGFDNTLYEAGNYFQTTEQIEEFRKGVKALVGIK